MRKLLLLAVIPLASCCYPAAVPYHPTAPLPQPLPAQSDSAAWVYRVPTIVAVDANEAPRQVTPEEMSMAANGARIANAVLKSDCFRDGVVQATMTHTNNLSPSDVYARMTAGPPLDLTITIYDGTKKYGTVGWDSRAEPSNVHMNRYFVKSAYLVADNLLHEAAHARGFIHKSSKEARSVPYTMNEIFEACASRFQDGDGAAAPDRLGDESEHD